ncbi:hypothetical protein Q5P01_014599 [Channa striata]|uniref:Uncharacterized protein n=1 Tax=Channa striata TaxID=64152 RepID=A0AA88MK73_CHASR|nr:hypothetical protein Q5P01_014599 [Channa striata]
MKSLSISMRPPVQDSSSRYYVPSGLNTFSDVEQISINPAVSSGILTKREHRTKPDAPHLVNQSTVLGQSVGPPSLVHLDNQFTVLKELESLLTSLPV